MFKKCFLFTIASCSFLSLYTCEQPPTNFVPLPAPTQAAMPSGQRPSLVAHNTTTATDEIAAPNEDPRQAVREHARNIFETLILQESTRDPFHTFVRLLTRRNRNNDWRTTMPFLDLTHRGAWYEGQDMVPENYLVESYIGATLDDLRRLNSPFAWGYDGHGRPFIAVAFTAESYAESLDTVIIDNNIIVQTFFLRYTTDPGNWAPQGNGPLGRGGGLIVYDFIMLAQLIRDRFVKNPDYPILYKLAKFASNVENGNAPKAQDRTS